MQYFDYFEFKIDSNAFNLINILWYLNNNIKIIISESCIRTRGTISKENECDKISEEYLSFIHI